MKTGRRLSDLRSFIDDIPIAGDILRIAYTALKRISGGQGEFTKSTAYWDRRYREGGSSGPGSRGRSARYKAEFINAFVEDHGIRSVVEFGCGDGSQLALSRYPHYRGYDVSPAAVQTCRSMFSEDGSKEFGLVSEYRGETYELALSLDVLYHLVEDDVFTGHMELLFSAAERYVIIYSSNSDSNVGYTGSHVRHRVFTTWVAKNKPGFRLLAQVPGWSLLPAAFRSGRRRDFFIYEKHSF